MITNLPAGVETSEGSSPRLPAGRVRCRHSGAVRLDDNQADLRDKKRRGVQLLLQSWAQVRQLLNQPHAGVWPLSCKASWNGPVWAWMQCVKFRWLPFCSSFFGLLCLCALQANDVCCLMIVATLACTKLLLLPACLPICSLPNMHVQICSCLVLDTLYPVPCIHALSELISFVWCVLCYILQVVLCKRTWDRWSICVCLLWQPEWSA